MIFLKVLKSLNSSPKTIKTKNKKIRKSNVRMPQIKSSESKLQLELENIKNDILEKTKNSKNSRSYIMMSPIKK